MDDKKVIEVKEEDIREELDFEFTEETIEELTNGKGDDEDE
jgi:hypothetical protein